jgi:hypothetical protein
MRTNTRYFVVGSLLTLATGLGVGLVAYSTGFSTSAFAGSAGPDELRFVPATAALVAYADVHDIMASDLRQKVHAALPGRQDGQHEFQDATGINIETDIDHVVVAVVPGGEQTGKMPGAAVVLARGRFDQVKIEALMREHGATVDDYKGARLVVTEAAQGHPAMSLAFLQPGLVAVGTSTLIKAAVDLKAGGSSVTTNDELMGLVRDVQSGNAWAAGRFDALTARANLPEGVAQNLPPVSLFSVSTHIDSGVRGTLRADARDDQSATNLRDMMRGILAMAKLQAGSRPDLGAALQSLQLAGDGRTVLLSFDLPASAIDAVAAMAPHRQPPASPQQ